MTLHRNCLLAAMTLVTAMAASFASARQPGAPAAAPSLARPTADDAAGDAAVLTVIDSNPTSPAEVVRAAVILADLGRNDLAKTYLQMLAAKQPGKAALADAGAQVGADLLMRVAGNDALKPEGRNLASAMLAARAKQTRDPARLRETIDRLADRSTQIRRAALIDVLAAREDAAPALIAALSDPARAAVHPMARRTLVEIGEPVVAPLCVALQSGDEELKVQLIDVLQQIGKRDAAIYLVGPAVDPSEAESVREAARRALERVQGSKNPSSDDAIELLGREITELLRGRRPRKADIDGNVAVWRFSEETGLPVFELVAREHADAMVASRVATDLFRIASDDAMAQRLYLQSHLQAAAHRAGLHNRLSDDDHAMAIGTQLGPQMVEAVLADSLANGLLPAAQGAAQLLGESGDATFLQATGATPRPIVTALSHGNRGVRFAAAEAIMRWKLDSGFAGSSDLVKALVWFGSSPGQKRALVGYPNESVAGNLASMLGASGYEHVDVATNGRRAYLQALASGDYELAVLSCRLDRPPVSVLVQELRRNPKTADLPILLLAEEGEIELARTIAAGDRLTHLVDRPLGQKEMDLHLQRLAELTADRIASSELRGEQALQSLQWLGILYEAAPQDFNIRPYEAEIRRAMYSPDHSAAAANLLALIGTHTAQKSLVDLANMAAQPLAQRQAAAAAFSRSVRRHGVQLTSGEITAQYDRYNASENEGADSQQLLALILDAIELQ